MAGRRKNKKTAWFRMLIFVVVFVAAAIVFGRDGTEKEEETVWQDGSMLRIGDTQVDYREGMIYLNAVQEDYEQYYGNDIWKYTIDGRGNTMGELIKEQVLDQIIYIKVICQKADELGIVLTEEELKQVENQTKTYMNKIQDSNLLQYGVNTDIVRRIYTDNLLARKTFEVTTLNVDTDIPNEEAEQRTFQAIAIRKFKIDPSGNRVSYEGKDLEEVMARMETLLEQAKTTTNFYKLALANTEDTSTLQLTGGKGEFNQEYEAELYALSTGEVSEIISTEDYFYIFYCVYDFDIDATYAKKEEMIALRYENEFRLRYEEWRQAIRVEINEEVWNSLDYETDTES